MFLGDSGEEWVNEEAMLTDDDDDNNSLHQPSVCMSPAPARDCTRVRSGRRARAEAATAAGWRPLAGRLSVPAGCSDPAAPSWSWWWWKQTE